MNWPERRQQRLNKRCDRPSSRCEIVNAQWMQRSDASRLKMPWWLKRSDDVPTQI
jgi:hypothetical protein